MHAPDSSPAPAHVRRAAVAMRRADAVPAAASFGTSWDPVSGVLATHLSGRPTREHIAAWDAGLQDALAASAGAPLRILVELSGYEVADVPWEVHREQRDVVPRLLSALGHRFGYLDLARGTPGRAAGAPSRVVAVAHVDHDRDKSAHYEALLASRNDRYFSDRAAAHRWLREFPTGSLS